MSPRRRKVVGLVRYDLRACRRKTHNRVCSVGTQICVHLSSSFPKCSQWIATIRTPTKFVGLAFQRISLTRLRPTHFHRRILPKSFLLSFYSCLTIKSFLKWKMHNFRINILRIYIIHFPSIMVLFVILCSLHKNNFKESRRCFLRFCRRRHI